MFDTVNYELAELSEAMKAVQVELMYEAMISAEDAAIMDLAELIADATMADDGPWHWEQ